MVRLASRLTLVLLAGCSCGSDPERAGTTTGTTQPPPLEICDNGLDDDGNGLLDCEDEACLEATGCIEVCRNNQDDDGDALIDCEDEDCWGSEDCRVAMVGLDGADHAFFRRTWSSAYYVPAPACNAFTFDLYPYSWSSFGLAAPRGTIRLFEPGATDWVSCTWTADSSVVMRLSRYSESSGASVWTTSSSGTGVARRGLAVGPGCTFLDHQPGRIGELFDDWELTTDAGNVEVRTRGVLWATVPSASFSGPYLGASTTLDTSMGCSMGSRYRRWGATFDSAQPAGSTGPLPL